MLKIKRVSFVLVLIGVAGLVAYSQEKGSEYVSPSEAVPTGRAPKMQVQLLNPGESTKQYAVIFYPHEQLIQIHDNLCGAITLFHYRAPLPSCSQVPAPPLDSLCRLFRDASFWSICLYSMAQP